MSNAKLKEQIEAAKIALVNSAEAGTDANAPRKSGNVTQIPKISTDNPQLHLDGASEEPHSLVRAKPQIENQDTIDQSDFKNILDSSATILAQFSYIFILFLRKIGDFQ